MALFALQENREILATIAEDVCDYLSNDLYLNEVDQHSIARQEILIELEAGIKANGDTSKLVRLNKLIRNVDDLNWLERFQLKLEKKIKSYDMKLKKPETGTMSKIWTNIKRFLVKVLNVVVSSINKVHQSVKIGYRAGKDDAQTFGLGSSFEVAGKLGQTGDNVRRKIGRSHAAQLALKDKKNKTFKDRLNAAREHRRNDLFGGNR